MPKRAINPRKGWVSHGPAGAISVSGETTDLFMMLRCRPSAAGIWRWNEGEKPGLRPAWRDGMMLVEQHPSGRAIRHRRDRSVLTRSRDAFVDAARGKPARRAAAAGKAGIPVQGCRDPPMADAACRVVDRR